MMCAAEAHIMSPYLPRISPRIETRWRTTCVATEAKGKSHNLPREKKRISH